MSVFKVICANAARASVRHYQQRMGATFPAVSRVMPRLSVTGATNTTAFQPRKSYSTSKDDDMVVQYEDVQSLIKGGEGYCLIDVREPSELVHGSIPTSRNIPLSQFLYAWSLPPKEFKEEFGFEKPSNETKVIVYCQAGIRSKSAFDFLREIGYKSVLNYTGSWKDYAQRSKQ